MKLAKSSPEAVRRIYVCKRMFAERVCLVMWNSGNLWPWTRHFHRCRSAEHCQSFIHHIHADSPLLIQYSMGRQCENFQQSGFSNIIFWSNRHGGTFFSKSVLLFATFVPECGQILPFSNWFWDVDPGNKRISMIPYCTVHCGKPQ